MPDYSVSKIVAYLNQTLKECIRRYIYAQKQSDSFNSEVMCQIGFGSFSIRVCQQSFFDSDNQQNQYSLALLKAINIKVSLLFDSVFLSFVGNSQYGISI